MAQAGQKRKADADVDVEDEGAGPSNAQARRMQMAADFEKAFAELRSQAECPVCSEVFADPRILPACGHTLCQECVTKMLDLDEAKKLECPTCRKISDLAPNDEERAAGVRVRELIKNYQLAGQAELLRKQIEAIPSAPCGNCKNEQAAIACGTCGENFCGACSELVHKIPAFSWHPLQPYRRGAEAIKRFTCAAHPSQPLLFCKEKCVEACLQCMHMAPAEHAGHAHISIAEGAASLEAALAVAIESGKAKLRDLEELEGLQEALVGLNGEIQIGARAETGAAREKAMELRTSVDELLAGWTAKISSRAKKEEVAAILRLSAIRKAMGQLRAALEDGVKLGGATQIQLVRLQPKALARITNAISGGAAMEVSKSKPIRFLETAVQISESGAGPVRVGDTAVVTIEWDEEKKKIESDAFLCGGLPWMLQVFPQGNGDGKGTHVSLFIASGIKNAPKKFRLDVTYELKCGRFVANGDKGFSAEAMRDGKARGRTKFASTAEFENLVKDGKVQVEVTMYEAAFVPA